MLARVTTWEGGSADGIRAAAEDMRSKIGQGPPPGLKSEGVTMLINPEGGRVLVIGTFASREDLQASEQVLANLDPPEGIGDRSSVEVFEVGAEANM
jgi:hypothetical protein